MMKSVQQTIRGTVIPFLIHFSYISDESITLDTINWSTEWYTGMYNPRTAVCVKKEECIREIGGICGCQQVNFIAYVDTGSMQKGNVKMRINTLIPDVHAKGGLRLEKEEICTDIILS